jgi:hypothetical protein
MDDTSVAATAEGLKTGTLAGLALEGRLRRNSEAVDTSEGEKAD